MECFSLFFIWSLKSNVYFTLTAHLNLLATCQVLKGHTWLIATGYHQASDQGSTKNPSAKYQVNVLGLTGHIDTLLHILFLFSSFLSTIP